MAFRLPWLKPGLLSALAATMVLAAASPALAAGFRPGRGLNMDIWVTWPSEDQWGDRSVMLPFPEWRQYVTDDELREVRQAGIDTIRVPVDPRPLLSPNARPLREELEASVIDSITLLEESGFRVILDLHVIPDGETPHRLFSNERLWTDYLRLVGDFASRLATFKTATVALEPINEPPTECAGRAATVWQRRMEELHRAIRTEAPDLTIVATGGCMSSAEGLGALDPAPFDDWTLFTFHSYAPFLLTHQGASWAGDVAPHVSGLPFPPYGENEDEAREALDMTLRRVRSEAPILRRAGIAAYIGEEFALIDSEDELRQVMGEPFETVSRWAERHGIPNDRIFLGEFGMIRQEYGKPFVTPPSDRAAYYRASIALAERNGFGWAMWGWGGAFGIVDAFDRRAERQVLDMIEDLPPPHDSDDSNG